MRSAYGMASFTSSHSMTVSIRADPFYYSSINCRIGDMAAYRSALRSQVDCVEIDVSRSLDGVLLALHDRDLQRISGNITSKVGHLSMKEIKKLGTSFQFAQKSHDQVITTIEDALTLVSNSVRKVILDAKVGPPSYEKGLAKDILSVASALLHLLLDYAA
ncbi:glycerophosphodiester phosphodiesterase GDPD4 [Citrus sinensis]|uniref:Glycerophosphodiester phosphodiesterase GDPD4 n=1 Tax=Citrus sinensis TaxID=2711 RepID=A0ACB8M8X5_CITSI|nr:glycerophosphodiester phosphodiesterase GDPD4 [Citrus sinensis]